MIIEHEKGLKLIFDNFSIAIDPLKLKETADYNFFTHAHRDHINLTKKIKEKKLFMTKTTANVAKQYFGDFDYVEIKENKKINIDNISISFFNSGHTPGSIAINIESEKKITITSDINNEKTVITDPVNYFTTDYLIIESTYGDKENIFPKREKEYLRFLEWFVKTKQNFFPVILAYPFGKTQEIISFLNKYTNTKIALSEKTYNITKEVLNLKNFNKINNINDYDALILSPNQINKNLIVGLEYSVKRKIKFANLTGHDNRFGENFKISNHADFNGLKEIILNSNAEKVFTYHGKKESLANSLKHKINISSLEKKQEIKI